MFGTLAAIYLAILGYLFWTQDSKIFLPNYGGRELVRSPADVGLEFKNVELTTDDGTRIHAWFVPHDTPRAILIYCHGNAGNIGRRLNALLRWHRLGVSVLIFDYPGYGESEGRPSEQGTYASARAAWDHLTKTKRIPGDEIVLLGRSLGGGVATQLAAEVEAKALIIESGNTSVPDLAAEIYWWLPVRLLMTVRFDTQEKIKAVNYPVLIAHSPDDELAPYTHGRKLYETANDPKRL